MDLKNKVVFITGGSSGIGLACAKYAAGRGAGVAIFARNRKRLREALADIESCRVSPGQRFKAYSLDVSRHVDVELVMRLAVKEAGVPFILINSAGLGGAFHFEDLPYRRFDDTIKINLYGTRNTIASLLPFMKGKGGHIVNVSSVGGLIGVFGYTAYAASKFGVVGFSECLRSELKGHGINVTVLCPSDTDTPMMRSGDATKPEETKAISGTAGFVSADYVAEALYGRLEKKRPLIIPGFKGRFFFLVKRLFPCVPEAVMDATIRRIRSRKGR